MGFQNLKSVERVLVLKGQSVIGTLSRTNSGSVFEYDPSYRSENANLPQAALCYRMPLSESRYEIHGTNLHPFFAGLLPEGIRLQTLVRNLKTSADDLFSLLLAAGSDTIGDISLRLPDDLSASGATVVQLPEPGQISFWQIFEESLQRQRSEQTVNDLSVAGVQPKVSGSLISFPVTRRKNQKQYILKLSPSEFPRLVENEHYFMKAAKFAGLDLPQHEVVYDKDGVAGFLIERFDRRYDPSTATFAKLHQEDACQFTDRYPADKYRLRFLEVATAVQELSSAPMIEILRLVQLHVFCYLIGNGDLHAKNISLLTDPATGRVGLSPVYDLVCTFAYGDERMALEFEGRQGKFRRKQILEFARRFSVPDKSVIKMLDEMCAAAPNWIDNLDQIGFPERKTAHLKLELNNRLSSLLAAHA